MALDKIIQLRCNNNYLKMLDEILEHERTHYHFVGERSDLIRLIIWSYYEKTMEEIKNENNSGQTN